jgi:hypothetical protein
MKRVITLLLGFIVLVGWGFSETIPVTSPNATSKWDVGGQGLILWQKCPEKNPQVKIILLDKAGVKKITVIANSTDNNGSYNWEIPNTVKAGWYRVGVKVKTVNVSGMSVPFEIKGGGEGYSVIGKLKGVIKVFSPQKGDDWHEGKAYTIEWNNKFTKNKQVKIQLYDQKGENLVKDIITTHFVTMSSSQKTTKYNWTIPVGTYKFPGKFTIKISTTSGTAEGFSQPFHISAAVQTIKASIKASISNPFRRKYSYKHVPTKIDTKDQNPGSVPAGMMRIGFKNSYKESGIGGINHRYLGFAYRGILYFNIDQFKGKPGMLLKAKMHLTKHSTVRHQGMAASTDGSCAHSLHLLTAQDSGFSTPASLLTYMPQYQGTNELVEYDGNKNMVIDVLKEIRDWIQGNKPNYGFMIIGPNESFTHNNDQCVTLFENIILRVEFLTGQ